MSPDAATGSPPRGRHFSGIISRQILRYAAHVLGEAEVDDLVTLAGDLPPRRKLEDPATWLSYDETRRLFAAAHDMLGGIDGLRAAGGYFDAEMQQGAVAFQSLGSPAEILRLITETTAKYATVLHQEAVEVTDDYGIVAARSTPGFPRWDHLCALTTGVLGQGAELFGLPPSTVVEEQCETEGADQCVFRVSWASDVVDGDRQIAQLTTELAQSRQMFTNLQRTVQGLVSGEDVDSVLGQIISRARRAVTAPQYLLAVRLGGDASDVSVHQIGFDPAEADLMATELLAPDPGQICSRLVVDVRSGDRLYGRLAACNNEGVSFFPEERTHLAAYAELAAAALDSATALEESRRQAGVARALLDLGRALARLSTAEEAAQRLAESVPATVGCEMAAVMLLDPRTRTLRVRGVHGMPPKVAGAFLDVEVQESDTPYIATLISNPTPVFFDRDVVDPYITAMMRMTDSRTAVAVPITNGERVYGVVVASSHTLDIRPDEHLLQRVAGIADQGATALQNAELVGAIRYQALHDALTDTPNQRLFEDRVDHALRQARRDRFEAAVLFLDLDRFKKINDTLGHAVGDLLLQHVAERLRTSIREVDTVSRLGGDEFAVLLPGLGDREEATLVAQRILESFEQPFHLDGHELFITSSIGIAAYPDDGGTYHELLKSADTAMYEAKSTARGTFRTYASTMPAKTADALTLEADLHGAVARGELRTVYQPIVDPVTAEVIHAEALVRWEHPRLGLLAPDEFIPMAEDSGLITVIDTWMLRSVCHLLARLEAEGIGGVGIAVNVSERDLRDPAFIDSVTAALDESGVPGHLLELEITERVAEVAGPAMDEALERLATLAVRVAIDDFGTGNSVISRLTRGHIDTLKIDRSFMAEVDDEYSPAPLLRAMIALGQSLGAQIVAEGVETAAQRAFICLHGCDLAQGFYFSRPLDETTFETLVRDSYESPYALTVIAEEHGA